MKRFNIYWLFVFCFIFASVSCSKNFLKEDFKSSYAPGNTYIDSLGFEAGIAGLQETFRADYSNTQGLLATFYVGTDEAISGLAGNTVQIPFDDYRQLNSQSSAPLLLWVWAYKVIGAANLIIESAQSPDITISDHSKNLYLAEAKFYRAYCYNFLTNLFGAVPLITEPVTTAKTDFVRDSVQDLIQFEISDLLFSEANLPDIDHVAKEDRINNAAASQLLSEIYLKDNKPDSAEIEAQKIINSSLFKLITTRFGVNASAPGDPFSDMFITGNQRRSAGNTESIWVVEQQYNVTGGDAGFDQHRREWVPYYVNVAGMAIADSLGGRGIGRIRPTNWWTYSLYEQNDMRNSPFSIKRTYYYNDPASPKFGQKVVATGIDTLQSIYAHPTKWYFYVSQEPAGVNTVKDRIQMRLGETYLLLAEAQFKEGKLQDAANSINVLRNRAHASLVTANQVDMDLILDERARELIAEELRRNTLVRTGTLIERVKKYNPQDAPTIQDFNLYLPIPQNEIDLNKDAVLAQNTGYN